MNKDGQTKLASSIITLLVVGALFLATPASAVNLYIGNSWYAYEGEIAEFELKVDLQPGERIPIQSVTFTLEGPVNKTCTFTVQGTPISGCDDLTITLTQNTADYGYGYGYGYGITNGYGYGTNFGYGYGYGYTGFKEIRWTVSWDTTNYPLGEYTADYRVNSPGRSFETGAPSTILVKKFFGDEPVVTFITPDNLETIDTTPTIEFTVTDDTANDIDYWFIFNDNIIEDGVLANNTTTNVTLGPLAPGTYNYTVKVFDGSHLTRYTQYITILASKDTQPIVDDINDIDGITGVRIYLPNGTEVTNTTIPANTTVTIVMTTTVNGGPATVTLPGVNIDDFTNGDANVITNTSNALVALVKGNGQLSTAEFVIQFQNFTNLLPLSGFQGVEITFSVPTAGPFNRILWISDDEGNDVTELPQRNSAPTFPITESNMGYRRNSGNVTIWIPHLSGAAGGLAVPATNTGGSGRSARGGFPYELPAQTQEVSEPTAQPEQSQTVTLDQSDVTETIEGATSPTAAPTPAPQAQERGRFARLTGFATGDGEGVPAWTKAILLGFVVFVVAVAGITGVRRYRK